MRQGWIQDFANASHESPDRAGPPGIDAGRGDHSPPGRHRSRKRKRPKAAITKQAGLGPPTQSSELAGQAPNSVQQISSIPASSNPKSHENPPPPDVTIEVRAAQERLLHELTWKALATRPYAIVLFLEHLARRIPMWVAGFIVLDGYTKLHHFAMHQVSQTRFAGVTQQAFTMCVQVVVLLLTWRLARRE